MRFRRYFIVSAGLILALTGAAKVISAFGSAKVLALEDPIIGITFQHLMLMVGGLELLVAYLCVFSPAHRLSVAVVAWLATSFVIYRVGLAWGDYQKPCSCMGSLTDALHISPRMADTAAKIALGYLLLGSYATLFWLSRQKRLVGNLAPTTSISTPSS